MIPLLINKAELTGFDHYPITDTHMTFETIKFELNDGVARPVLNRPDKLNSFNNLMHEELRSCLHNIDTSNDVRSLLITANSRGFCAGLDLGDRELAADAYPPDLGESIEKNYNPLIRKLRSLEIPVICAVNGVAAGAGANLALSCDIVLAARSASFIQSFCKIGLGYIKRAIQLSSTNSLDDQLDLERDLQRQAGRTRDFNEGVDAFMNKREPKFNGQ